MIKINNKEISLRFGMLSVEIFSEKTSDDDIKRSYLSSYGMSSMIYAGMVNYYKVKGELNPFTFVEIYDWVEDSLLKNENTEALQKVVSDFVSCQPFKKKTEPKENVVEEKKSPISSNSEKRRLKRG
jgi:hypothetical protein